jgi:hypothetical protein
MGNNLLVYTSAPAGASDAYLWAAACDVVCGNIGCECGSYGEAGARYGNAGRAEFISIGIARSSWLFRETGMRRMRCMLGVYAGADFVCDCPWGIGCGWRSRARRFRCMTAILRRGCCRSRRTTGTGSVRRSRSCIRRSILQALHLPAQGECMVDPRGRGSGSLRFRRLCWNGVASSFAMRERWRCRMSSMRVEKGEFVSLLGPSGCGKSTLLRLVSGLTPATAGAMSVNGMTPANARELMSFIFQDATLLPWRTVEQNVGLGMELEHAARWLAQEKKSRRCWS